MTGWRRSERRATGYSEPGEKVERFQGPHKFLSNFFWSELRFEGLSYPSVEHAFQAAKLRSNKERQAWGFTEPKLSFGDAKRLGRQVPLRDDWKDIREEVMAQCLAAKFSDPVLRQRLLATQGQLVDGHSGSPDLVWGYHIPSQQGENRLGHMLMDLRSKLYDSGENTDSTVVLYHLDWPVKCLHDGLPAAYAARIRDFAQGANLGGCIAVLPRRRICIALRGSSTDVESWERRMRTEHVDVNSRGKPCRERMLVELFRRTGSIRSTLGRTFDYQEVPDWAALCRCLSGLLGELPDIAAALGPEVPELPRNPRYVTGPAGERCAVIIHGQRWELCLNDATARAVGEALLGPVDAQVALGSGEEIPLNASCGGIFGGKFARELEGLLSPDECQRLIKLSEGQASNRSKGFNPFAHFALRCLVDAPLVAQALTRRLRRLLPSEYPPQSGRQLLGVNQRLRFLKYVPGMHHSDHTDCAHEDEAGRSFLTVQLYLNDRFSGGRTTFISDRLVPIEPTPGKAAIFDHELYHRGQMVTSGVKYAVRMDVSYGAPGAFEAPGAPAERRKGRWGRK
ncbi:unnamed protein product [Effrenium voratum]|uniref:Fe2OG dioxygenase domain-containing protein n=1 Tax=Effrenium voratum TaxID=2562239 RepID=A0AA36NFA9_9DINO|nr:unnamed protein product [Effrenium voratum]